MAHPTHAERGVFKVLVKHLPVVMEHTRCVRPGEPEVIVEAVAGAERSLLLQRRD